MKSLKDCEQGEKKSIIVRFFLEDRTPKHYLIAITHVPFSSRALICLMIAHIDDQLNI